MATDQLTDEVSRVVMSLFNSSEAASLTSFFLKGLQNTQNKFMLRMYTSPLTDEYLYYASILSAIHQVFIHSFKSNTLQNKLARVGSI